MPFDDLTNFTNFGEVTFLRFKAQPDAASRIYKKLGRTRVELTISFIA